MSDELKSCPHCGNNDYVTVEGTVSSNNFQVVCNWLSGGCGASGGVRRTQAEAIAAWNTRSDDATCKAKQAVDKQADTREKLEADVRSSLGFTTKDVFGWLDRQAAITEREVKERVDFSFITQTANALFPDYQEQIAELTAERDQYEVLAVNAELWKDERDNLQAAIDAMHNGQFYAMYRKACEERDHLKKVVQTNAESFRKMEADLHALNSGETLNTLRASVAGLKDTVEKQKAEIERLRDENAELNMQVHGAPF